MPDRYLSFSRVAVSFGALVSVAALRSTTTVLSMESWVGGGGTRRIVRSSRDTSRFEGENFVYRFLARYTGRRGSCSRYGKERKKERKIPRDEGLKRGMEFLLFQIFDSFVLERRVGRRNTFKMDRRN